MNFTLMVWNSSYYGEKKVGIFQLSAYEKRGWEFFFSTSPKKVVDLKSFERNANKSKAIWSISTTFLQFWIIYFYFRWVFCNLCKTNWSTSGDWRHPQSSVRVPGGTFNPRCHLLSLWCSQTRAALLLSC